MAKSFKVSSQGIAKDLGSATGSYDTLEHGVLDSDKLYEALQKFKAIKEIVPQGNEDICPPSLYVDCEGKDYSFYLSEGEIINLNTEAEMSNEDRRFAFEFYDKNDGQDVLNKAQNLLTQQN